MGGKHRHEESTYDDAACDDRTSSSTLFLFFGETSDNQQGIAIAVHESTGSVTKHEQHTRCSHAWPGLKSVGSGQQKRRHTCVSGS